MFSLITTEKKWWHSHAFIAQDKEHQSQIISKSMNQWPSFALPPQV